MRIEKIKTRSVLFRNTVPAGWDICVQLIIGDTYNYIIDTGLGSLNMAPVLDYIHPDNKPIIVINTHSHWDHIWGNHTLRNSTIVSHKLCREMIDSHWDDMLLNSGKHLEGETEKCLPTLTFEGELYFPEDRIRLIYTPGHTIDSISVMDEIDQVIHVGDNIGDSMDELVPSLYCDKETYRHTLLKYKELDCDTFVSGHNQVLGKEVMDQILELL
ncbi:MBL fold metallo-hydrolase [Paenibacillus sp. KN14-4R]|uniref:MBL fold metallo-hydrolase n=1 Tax=Paenibacillus sp. KN14-4R TaxID=3445773 RepID=UPI003FA0F683